MDVIKMAVHNVELTIRRIAGEVKVAVERLHEAIIEAVARLLQWLGEHWRVLALVTAGVLTWMAARHVLAEVDVSQFAKLAAGGFFGVVAVKEDRKMVLDELRKVVKKVRELAEQASRHSPLFGEWKPQEGVREAGKVLLDKAVSFARHKGLDKGAEGRIVKLSAVPRGREAAEGKVVTFDALGDVKVARAAWEAASAIRRVVEGAEIAVRPVVAIASRALAKAKKVFAEEREWERLIDVGLADAEFRRTFNVAGRPLYFVYPVGDVEYGAVKARGVRAVAFVSGKKTLRIEILAEGVEGLSAEAERVRALGREWVRLATFEIDVGFGVVYLTPRVEVSVQVRTEPVLAKQLSALALTDAGHGGRLLGSPDPILHLLYALAVREAVIKVAHVVFTEAGPTSHLLSTAPAEHVNWLYEEVARELSELGVVVGVKELRRMAKAAAVKTIGEYAEEVKRIAKEARSVEELRAELIELFDKALRKAAEEYRRTGSEEALWRAVGAAVAKKFFAENVDDPVWWALLILGDGVVRVRGHAIGFAAKPVETAEAVMYVFARVMGVLLEVQRVENNAVLSRGTSRVAVEELFKRLEEAGVGNTSASQLLTAVAEWWLGVGTGGSDPPKLLSLLAFRELIAGEEEEWLRAWLSYQAASTPMPEAVEKWLDGVYRVSVEPSRDPLTGAVSFDAEFERDGKRFRLHTDLSSFFFYCESCGGVAEGVLKDVASALEVKPRWYGNAIVLPADVGWPMFLKLWTRHNMFLPIVKGGRELLRVEVLEARADGTAKFRLWYYKWRETRPDKPYVDVELRPYPLKDGRVRLIDHVYANEAEGILREHLAEIADLLKREGVKGVSPKSDGKGLQFTGAFRDSVLARLGIRPELPPGEPLDVEYMDNYRFKVGSREVEFKEEVVSGRYEFYAKLTFPSRDEAEEFARSLKAVGIDARIVGSEKVGYTVRLDSDAFFGLLAYIGATPPGLSLLYRSKEGDFRVYASTEGKRMRLYFAVKHEGVWRAAEGLYSSNYVLLQRAERAVLEAIKDAVTKALKQLGCRAEVGEPRKVRGKKGNVEAYYLKLYDHHLAPILEHAAEDARAKPAEVRLEGRLLVVKTGDVETAVEFKLLKRHRAEYLLASNVEQTLALYRSLKEVGVPVKLTPRGVKVDEEAMWALVATAIERDTPGGLSAGVMPGVELVGVHNAGGKKMYIFRVSEEGVHYYFAVKTGEGWRAAGGKYSERDVKIAGGAVPTVAEAINALYREVGVERKVEVRYKNGMPYIKLTNVDLELLGPKRQ